MRKVKLQTKNIKQSKKKLNKQSLILYQKAGGNLMTKKILLATALAVLLAVPVFAAANNNQDQDSFRGGCNQRGNGNYQNCPYNNGSKE